MMKTSENIYIVDKHKYLYLPIIYNSPRLYHRFTDFISPEYLLKPSIFPILTYVSSVDSYTICWSAFFINDQKYNSINYSVVLNSDLTIQSLSLNDFYDKNELIKDSCVIPNSTNDSLYELIERKDSKIDDVKLQEDIMNSYNSMMMLSEL